MKKLVVIRLLFAFSFCSAQAQTASPYWEEIVAFRKLDSVQPPPVHAIVFVGSSSFTKWKDVSDYFPGYSIINRGFGGSTLVDVIRYVYDIVLPYKPKQVVIYCGENDFAYVDTVSVAEVLRRFKTLYGMLRQNLPSSTISFVSIKPSPVRERLQEKVKAANNEIRLFLMKEKRAAFIDIYPAMLNDAGKMRQELYEEDRLHMKAEGYAIWQKIMLPYLLK
jgi:lysophospholipase L1-like esterase